MNREPGCLTNGIKGRRDEALLLCRSPQEVDMGEFFADMVACAVLAYFIYGELSDRGPPGWS